MFNKQFLSQFSGCTEECDLHTIPMLEPHQYLGMRNTPPETLRDTFFLLHHEIMTGSDLPTDKEKYLACASFLLTLRHSLISPERILEHLDHAVHYKEFKIAVTAMYAGCHGRIAMERMATCLGTAHAVITILSRAVPHEFALQSLAHS